MPYLNSAETNRILETIWNLLEDTEKENAAGEWQDGSVELIYLSDLPPSVTAACQIQPEYGDYYMDRPVYLVTYPGVDGNNIEKIVDVYGYIVGSRVK